MATKKIHVNKQKITIFQNKSKIFLLMFVDKGSGGIRRSGRARKKAKLLDGES